MRLRVGATGLMAVVLGCSRNTPAPTASDQEDVVARVGERVFRVADVESRLNAQPGFVRARFSSPETRREFVDQLVRNELLVQEARRRGLDRAPEAEALFEKLLVQQLVADVARASQPTEADARAYFDGHPEEFTRPERVRLAVVEFGGTATAPAPEKAAVEREVARLRAAVEPERTRLFTALIQARSTDPSRSQDGDIGPRTRQELTQQFSAEVAEAAFALRALGEIGLAPTARGFVGLRLTGRQPEERRSFETEKSTLLARLAAERRLSVVDELVKSLSKTTVVEVRGDALQRVDAGVR
ncbi:MAG: peptidyl-prolyl cis-trans isomerase [Myxococcaceae bacterium]|nr:peptidyl-prolyl cis-trans isomerase [Myxococcaceae bacterium]